MTDSTSVSYNAAEGLVLFRVMADVNEGEHEAGCWDAGMFCVS